MHPVNAAEGGEIFHRHAYDHAPAAISDRGSINRAICSSGCRIGKFPLKIGIMPVELQWQRPALGIIKNIQ